MYLFGIKRVNSISMDGRGFTVPLALASHVLCTRYNRPAAPIYVRRRLFVKNKNRFRTEHRKTGGEKMPNEPHRDITHRPKRSLQGYSYIFSHRNISRARCRSFG